MKIFTLYLDTSVIGGCFDDEWKEATLELFRQASLGLYHLTTSVVATREVLGAPDEVRQKFSSTFTRSAQIHELTAEAESLAQAYLAASVVTPKCGRCKARGHRHGSGPHGHRELELSPSGQPAPRRWLQRREPVAGLSASPYRLPTRTDP